MRIGLFSVVIVVLITFSVISMGGKVEAALIDNGYGLIYDTDLDITWYDYAYKGSQGNGATWEEAMTWAQELNVGGISGWRLPQALPVIGSSYIIFWSYDGSTDIGWNITSSTNEMSYLYYVVLGNKGLCDENGNCVGSDWGLNNTGPFLNLESFVYWSGSTHSPYLSSWAFDFQAGYQRDMPTSSPLFALAVHPGNVTLAVQTPEPSTFLLLGAGLAGVGIMRRKMRR